MFNNHCYLLLINAPRYSKCILKNLLFFSYKLFFVGGNVLGGEHDT